jgi:hypothetical protein
MWTAPVEFPPKKMWVEIFPDTHSPESCIRVYQGKKVLFMASFRPIKHQGVEVRIDTKDSRESICFVIPHKAVGAAESGKFKSIVKQAHKTDPVSVQAMKDIVSYFWPGANGGNDEYRLLVRCIIATGFATYLNKKFPVGLSDAFLYDTKYGSDPDEKAMGFLTELFDKVYDEIKRVSGRDLEESVGLVRQELQKFSDRISEEQWVQLYRDCIVQKVHQS